MEKENNKKIFNSFIKRFSIIISIKIVIILFFFINAQKKIESHQNTINYKPHFCYSGNCINLEIAKTPQEREIGLMFREKLDNNKGMIFIFNGPGKHGMWMRNVLIPLDIIRITTGNKVIDIVTAQPCKEENCPIYKPEIENILAIEINSGVSKQLGIKTGEIINLNI